MQKAKHSHRYNSLTILLHWSMALGFITMLSSGFAMVNLALEKSLQFNLYQWHKAGGVFLLLAFCVRLLTRFMLYYPPFPSSFSKLDLQLIKLGHWAFYGIMLVMPLTGWIMVSASIYGLPTIVFGWFEWPHLPNLQGNEGVESLAKNAHFLLALAFGGLILVHISAVFKHYFKDGINLLPRMWWSKRVSYD
jgi:cytochrome b561